MMDLSHLQRLFPKESICKKWGLHDYKRIIDNYEAIVEVCQKCGDKQIYNKGISQVNPILRDNTIDERKHSRSNARCFLQPHGLTREAFISEYGKPDCSAN